MKLYIKSSTQLKPELQSLNWERGENEGVVATAKDGDEYYGLMAEWFDKTSGDKDPDKQYCVYAAKTDAEAVLEMIDLDEEYYEDFEEGQDPYWYCEDYFMHETTDSNVVQDIGWYATEDEAIDVAEKLIGW